MESFLRDFIFQHRLRYMVYLRYAQNVQNKLLKLYFDYKLYKMSRKYGIEIKSLTSIGLGFVMGHPYNITVSPEKIIGKNVNILKGATIGASCGNELGVPRLETM